jgi:hypothetical protein
MADSILQMLGIRPTDVNLLRDRGVPLDQPMPYDPSYQVPGSPPAQRVGDVAGGALQALPSVGDAYSVLQAIADLEAGNYGDAAWNGVGALPMVAGIKSLTPRVFNEDVLASALADSRRLGGLVGNAIETDAQGVLPGKVRELDRRLDRGEITEDEVKGFFNPTLDLLRSTHGDTLTLWRSDVLEGQKTQGARTVYMADRDVAEQYARNGRKLEAYSVDTGDVLGVYARPSGYYEAIVKIPKGGLVKKLSGEK